MTKYYRIESQDNTLLKHTSCYYYNTEIADIWGQHKNNFEVIKRQLVFNESE